MFFLAVFVKFQVIFISPKNKKVPQMPAVFASSVIKRPTFNNIWAYMMYSPRDAEKTMPLFILL